MTLNKEEVLRIYQEEYIGEHLGTTTLNKMYPFDVASAFKKYNLKLRNHQEKNRKYTCNTDYFKEINTEEKAYWLGFAFADGYISQSTKNTKLFSITLSSVDINHLYKFQTAINSNKPIKEYRATSGYQTENNYCRLAIQDNAFAHNIIKQGCIEHKSNIIQPPHIEQQYYSAFIRGYFDGNGSIAITNTKYGPSFSIKIISTDMMLNWIMDILITNHIITHRYPLYKRKKEQIVSTFDFGGNKLSQKFLDYIYKDATIYLDRKYQRYQNLVQLNIERGYNIA